MIAYRNAGFDEWLDAIDDREGYYLECPNGHGSLPPRRACPQCGETDLADRSLPDTGVVETFTIVHIATPQLEEDTPYVTAIATFDGVGLTGMVRGIDPEEVTIGMVIEPAVDQTETTNDRVLVFDPV